MDKINVDKINVDKINVNKSCPLQRCSSINERRWWDAWKCQQIRKTGKAPDTSIPRHRTRVRFADEVALNQNAKK